MIDGLDGLAASLVLIASIALGIIAWSGGNAWGIAVLGLLSAAILAFLGFNLHLGRRALVFMGDGAFSPHRCSQRVSARNGHSS